MQYIEFLGLCLSYAAFFAPLVLIGGVILFLLSYFFGDRNFGKHYADRRAGRIAAASARAVLSPVTGRDASAAAAKLREEGASADAAAAWFVSKGQSAPEGVLAAAAVLGVVPALLRWFFAFISSAVLGFLSTPAQDDKKLKKQDPAAYEAAQAQKKEEKAARKAERRDACRKDRLQRSLAAMAAVLRCLPGLLAACVLGAAIATAFPDAFFTDMNFSGRTVTLFIALVLSFLVGSTGIACAPVVLALLARELDPGVGLLILCAAPVFNMTELYNLGRAIGRGKAIFYMFANCVPAFVGAKILQDLYMGKLISWTIPAISAKPMENAFFLPGIILLALLCAAGVILLLRSREGRVEIPEGAVKLYVSGGITPERAEGLKARLEALEGVSVIGVYAAKKLVLIRGAAEFDALSAACEAEGLQLDGTEE